MTHTHTHKYFCLREKLNKYYMKALYPFFIFIFLFFLNDKNRLIFY